MIEEEGEKMKDDSRGETSREAGGCTRHTER